MAKKKGSLSTVVAFMSSEAQARLAAETDAPAGTLPLAAIRPDPGQPRRLLPDDLAAAVAAGDLSPVEALRTWLGQAAPPAGALELKRLADSIARHGLINPISVRPPRPDETVPAGVTYFVVTGERRYWACVYLLGEGRTIQEGHTVADPAQIKATIAPPGVTVRAHQLVENLLREDINAVERAWGLWALRYELSGVMTSPPAPLLRGEGSEETSPLRGEGSEETSPLRGEGSGETSPLKGEGSLDEVNHGSPLLPSPPAGGTEGGREAVEESPASSEEDEASPVNHGSPSGAGLVPWARVEEVLGISKRYRIFATSVLNLAPAALALVRHHGLTERTIRPIVQKLKDRPDLQVQALEQLLARQAAADEEPLPPGGQVAAAEEIVTALLAGPPAPAPDGEPARPRLVRSVSSAPVVRFGSKIRQTLDFLNRLKPNDRTGLTEFLSRDEYAEIMLDLRNLRQQIDSLLDAASKTEDE